MAARGTNLAGDEQADKLHHGGHDQAVYAYASEDAAFWSVEIGRELAPGSFGENLTLADVDVSGAVIGERWRIGAAELRVAGPRVPCFKLEPRIGVRGFQRRFLHAGRPGAYLAIVGEGELQAGDPRRSSTAPTTTSPSRSSSRRCSSTAAASRSSSPRARGLVLRVVSSLRSWKES